jgi:hypothetical protein
LVGWQKGLALSRYGVEEWLELVDTCLDLWDLVIDALVIRLANLSIGMVEPIVCCCAEVNCTGLTLCGSICLTVSCLNIVILSSTVQLVGEDSIVAPVSPCAGAISGDIFGPEKVSVLTKWVDAGGRHVGCALVNRGIEVLSIRTCGDLWDLLIGALEVACTEVVSNKECIDLSETKVL